MAAAAAGRCPAGGPAGRAAPAAPEHPEAPASGAQDGGGQHGRGGKDPTAHWALLVSLADTAPGPASSRVLAPAGAVRHPGSQAVPGAQTGPVPELWDVVVVGAGPAGRAAALSALRVRPGASVLLLDRADFPRDKSCGDGIAPQVLDVLAELGVDGRRGRTSPPVSALSIGYPPGLGAAASGPWPGPARVVPAPVLDARLVAGRARRGCGAAPPHRALARRAPGRGGARRRPARADGGGRRRRRVRRCGAGWASRPNGPGHVAVAIRGYAPVRADLREEQRITLGREDWPEYAWSFPIGDGRANIGYGAVLRRGGRCRARCCCAGWRSCCPASRTDARSWRAHHLPLSSSRPRQPDGPRAAGGRRAVAGEPDDRRGDLLRGALRCLRRRGRGERSRRARPAAGVGGTAGGDPGAAYRRSCGGRLGRHLRHTSTAAVLARRPWVVDGALRGATRHPAAFDALVELGLGEGLLTPGRCWPRRPGCAADRR